jgi:hypothetical protein
MLTAAWIARALKQLLIARLRRQDGWKPRRQHRFAGARRPDHEKIVAAGGGHFERALGAFLALDIG